jgi:hypothetical protein
VCVCVCVCVRACVHTVYPMVVSTRKKSKARKCWESLSEEMT